MLPSRTSQPSTDIITPIPIISFSSIYVIRYRREHARFVGAWHWPGMRQRERAELQTCKHKVRVVLQVPPITSTSSGSGGGVVIAATATATAVTAAGFVAVAAAHYIRAFTTATAATITTFVNSPVVITITAAFAVAIAAAAVFRREEVEDASCIGRMAPPSFLKERERGEWLRLQFKEEVAQKNNI